jgi:hypothetical protein
MREDFTEHIFKKSFLELTAEEKNSIAEWCTSEEDFEQMASVIHLAEGIRTENQFEPKASTKDSLDALFMQRHPKAISSNWYGAVMAVINPAEQVFYRRPLMQVAAILCVILIALPFLFDNGISAPKQKNGGSISAKNERAPMQKKIKETKKEKEVKLNREEDAAILQASVDIPSEQIESTASSFSNSAEMSFSEVMDEPVAAAMMVEEAPAMRVATKSEAFSHPDGVYSGVPVKYSLSAKDKPGLLDLITVAF